LRIITINVNGIRAAARKGMFQWLSRQRADVVCLQEIRAQEPQLDDGIFRPNSFHCHYAHAERKGYSGVAIFSRRPPDRIVEGLGWPTFDAEARYVEAQYPGLSVVSGPSEGLEEQAARVPNLRRFQHRPQGHRPQELAFQPEEFRISPR
jgi:exodeoxyribonuclease-3